MKNIKKYWKYIIIIFMITALLLLKLLINSRKYGHDTIFHTANIIELSKTISLTNIFGSNIINFKSNIFGYGTWLFYPKLPHLLSSYLYLIFEDAYTSMNIIYFITTFLSGIFMFLLSKKIFNDKKIALISSAIYLTAPYHVTEIYIRDAYAENFMFLVIPLVFLGLYELKDNNYKKFYLTFIIGYTIGMYSHLISMVFLTIIVAIFILYHYKIFFKKEKLQALITSALIVTGLSLPFLITVIEYKLTNSYTVFLSPTFTNRQKVMIEALSLKEYYNQYPRIDHIKTYFNYLTIILFVITTIQIIFKKSKVRKKILPISLIIIILINLISSKNIWEHIPEFFLSIQFPWRLLVFLTFFVAIYAPTCLINNLKIDKKIKNIIFYIMIIIISIEGFNNIDYYGTYVYKEFEVLQSSLAMGYQFEYLPLVSNEDEDNLIYILTGINQITTNNPNSSIEILEDDFPSLTFEVKTINKTTEVELPRIYYLGYKLIDEDGKKIELETSKKGFLKADIEKEGVYKLIYTTTTAEKIANLIGISTLIIYIIFLVKRYKNEK